MNVDIARPASYPRRILVCVSGLSPQIITETLYALAVAPRPGQPSLVPTEIHVITTTDGAKQAKLSLLQAGSGQFAALCSDYGLDPDGICFDEDSFHLIPGEDGHVLDDIRSEADNAAAADAIMAVIRELTRDDAAAVHASIAGGRKTMGFFLGYAMSLLGRTQDRLSHVLVSSPFESHRQFYYPPAVPRVLEVEHGRDKGRLMHTADAVITLADIPFVRLRDSLDRTLLRDSASYSETVRRAQAGLEPVELVLDPDSRRIRAAGRVLQMNNTNFAFYAWFARRALGGKPALHWTDADPKEYLDEYARLVSSHSAEYVRVEEALRQGVTREYFDQRKSRLKEWLRRQLGPGPATPYQIVNDGLIPGTNYQRNRLALRPDQIRFAPLNQD